MHADSAMYSVYIGQYWGAAPGPDDVALPSDEVIDEKNGPSELCLHVVNLK